MNLGTYRKNLKCSPINYEIQQFWICKCWFWSGAEVQIESVQNSSNILDLQKWCRMNIWLQRSTSIQPRTGPEQVCFIINTRERWFWILYHPCYICSDARCTTALDYASVYLSQNRNKMRSKDATIFVAQRAASKETAAAMSRPSPTAGFGTAAVTETASPVTVQDTSTQVL